MSKSLNTSEIILITLLSSRNSLRIAPELRSNSSYSSAVIVSIKDLLPPAQTSFLSFLFYNARWGKEKCPANDNSAEENIRGYLWAYDAQNQRARKSIAKCLSCHNGDMEMPKEGQIPDNKIEKLLCKSRGRRDLEWGA
jgi:hypothetical protein